MDTIGRKHPKKIFVVAPVISQDAPDKLRAEFPKKVADLFHFVYFAKDGTPDENGMVWPGVGGNIYERLPLSQTGGMLTPRIVVERRQKHEAQLLSVI